MNSRQAFIEQVGLTAEADGLPRIAGRLFGFLLLTPEPASLDDIAHALGVSKGSVSTDARLLSRHGWLTRVSRPGDRRDYYELAPDFFARIVAYRLTRWQALHDLVAGAPGRLPQQPAAVRDRFAYLDAAQRHFLDGIQRLLAEWQPDAHAPEREPAPAERAAARSRP